MERYLNPLQTFLSDQFEVTRKRAAERRRSTTLVSLRDAGLRLDHLLLSPVLAPRLSKAGVDRTMRGEEGASDHAPAWIVLK